MEKVKELGLHNIYKTNNNFKKFTKLLLALAYVKKLILEQFNEIKNNKTFDLR
jgi:hypothetical protein